MSSQATPQTPKHLLEAPMHPRDTSKNFWQNRFLGLKMHFSSIKALRAWKNAFLSKIQRTKFFSRLCFMTNQVRRRKYRTKWKVLSSRFLIKHLFFEKCHFLHPHAQNTSQKLKKCFTFCLKKIEKNSKIYFSKNASIWLLITPKEFLSNPRTPEHLLGAPCTLGIHQKIFDKMDLWICKLKMKL